MRQAARYAFDRYGRRSGRSRFALAVSVNVLVVVVGFGAKPAVTPLGNPEALRVTLPVKPFSGETVMVLGSAVALRNGYEVGFALRLKSAVPPAQPGKMKLPIAVLQLKPSF